MKKISAVIIISLGLYICLFSQSINVKSPKGGEHFSISGSCPITWTSSGISGNVTLKLYRGGKDLGRILPNPLPASPGAYTWKIAASLPNGAPVIPAKNYQVMVRYSSKINGISKGYFTIDKAQSGNTLQLAPNQGLNRNSRNPRMNKNPNQLSRNQKMIIHSPKQGQVWKPFVNYTITWEVPKGKYPKSGYNFNVKLVSADNKPFKPFLLKQNYWYDTESTANNYFYSFNWKFFGSTNIPSGKYRVTIESISIPAFKGASGIITVNNTVSGNTAFLDEKKPNIIIENVYYDFYKKSMWVRIKNMGFNTYSGPLSISYDFKLKHSTYQNPSCKKGSITGKSGFAKITLNTYQSKGYFIVKWPCFDKRPGDFLPQTGPVKYQIYIATTGEASASKSGVICKTKLSDIILTDPIGIHGKFGSDFFRGFMKQDMNPGNYQWIAKNTFSAKLNMDVRNWGCQSQQFKIKLHMDGNYLNGKKEVTLGTLNLSSGQEIDFTSKSVNFSIPRDNKYYRLLVVAYQGEKNNEGYIDAYKNNFILFHVRLKSKSTTVRGDGW